METISLKLSSPYKEVMFENVEKCSIEANDDYFEILPEHTNLCNSVKLGKVYITVNKEESIFNFFNGSLNFDNNTNKLSILCLDFEHDKDLVSSIESIQQNLRSDSQSHFHLQFTEENTIALEKLEK